MVKSRSGPFLTPQKLPSNGSTGSETPFSEASSGKNQPQSSLKSASNGSTAPKTAFKPASNRPGGVKNPFQEASNGSSKPRSSLKLPSNGSTSPKTAFKPASNGSTGSKNSFSEASVLADGHQAARWCEECLGNRRHQIIAIFFPQPRARPDGLPIVFSRLLHQAINCLKKCAAKLSSPRITCSILCLVKMAERLPGREPHALAHQGTYRVR